MEIQDISLGHKALLHERLRAVDSWISEYSFPNLYLFRRVHEYRVIRDAEIFILGTHYDGQRYVMPTRDAREIDPRYLRETIAEYGLMYPVPEQWLEAFPTDVYGITYHDGDSDYIHRVDKLMTYGGKRLHDKKNLLNQFLKRYRHEALPLTNDRLGDALSVLEQWQRDMAEPPEQTDYYPCREAIERYEELMQCGGIYYADDEPAGFIIGEELHENVFALHFAKGKRSFKGLYQFMFNNFASIMPSRYCCLNFEQDMGKESLRQAKSTYEPEYMIKKYRISLK
ncbi:MAG: DUF2156 domain-containing protein [Spirochaetes bacterium]|nr:DUF2156 domain-containing protein [Spirochaetota bacterium]